MKHLLIFLFVVPLVLLSGCQESQNNPNDYETEGGELQMIIEVANETLTVDLVNNKTTRELLELLPMTITLQDMAHEKYYYLTSNLSTNPYNPKTIEAGDVMLFGNSCLVIFYESFSTNYAYTRLGKINETNNLKNLFSEYSTITIKRAS